MSTGQPPSDNSSDGEKRSKSGQSSEDSETDKSDVTGAQPSSLEEHWDPREAPTSSGRILAGKPSASPPNSNGVLPEFRTVPPGVSSPRGKFTVGNLLNASQGQGTASISRKRAEPLTSRPRQQIGALPQRAPARSTVPPAINHSDSVPNPPTTPSPPPVVEAVSEVESVASAIPSQPIAVAAVPEADAGSRPTPSQPFAVEVVSSVEGGLGATPSQPFGVERVSEADAGSRPTPSQPFVVEVVPKAAPQTLMATGARVERALAPHDLLAPPLIEKTPRGIGAVTLGSSLPQPSQPSNPVAMESTVFVVTPIVPIVAVPPAKGDASRQPAPARELDDPESWNVDVNPAPPAIAVEPPPPVAADLRRTSDRASRVSGSDPSPVAAKRSPSSQSKLERAAISEPGLSGEFFAALDVSEPPPELRQPQDSDGFMDERHRRSISPEVVARRTRYRVLVVRVIVGFVLVLVAAIVLKVMHKR